MIAAALAVGCERSPRGGAWSFEHGVGVAIVDRELACLSIAAELAPDSRVRVVSTMPPQDVFEARTVSVEASCVRSVDDGAAQRGYRLRFDSASPPEDVPMIAVVDPPAPFNVRDGIVTADLDGDRHDELFRSCTSSEGVHLTIWSGAALTGQRRWHAYRYLAYDVVANCTPQETAAAPAGRQP